ncbi:RIC8A isoform 13 [Pongo abelii]|uniref:RIC8A isoform 13 n=1 Tax=Pongo abelii TaxID=9601 RepID=A0A2J8XRV3_PONAB|nr:RIC8A isoform 13 [Pongo abelii]
MEPRTVAEAVETGKEDVIMEALRSYNQEWLLPELEANRPPAISGRGSYPSVDLNSLVLSAALPELHV